MHWQIWNRSHSDRRFFRAAFLKGLSFLLLLLAVALLFRFGFYKPCRIGGLAMANTLLPGDRIFANAWIYHVARRKGPKTGELVLFKVGKSSYMIKRCAAVSGQEVEIVNKSLLLNGRVAAGPETALRSMSASVPAELAPRDELPKIRIPSQGDTLDLSEAAALEFDYVASLIRQENPHNRILIKARLFKNNREQNDLYLDGYAFGSGPFARLPFDSMHWIDFQRVHLFLEKKYPGDTIRIERRIFKDGNELNQYVVQGPCFFALSDNWDEYGDSRTWGYVSSTAAIARPSFIYCSMDPQKKWYEFPYCIRWKRCFRLAR